MKIIASTLVLMALLLCNYATAIAMPSAINVEPGISAVYENQNTSSGTDSSDFNIYKFGYGVNDQLFFRIGLNPADSSLSNFEFRYELVENDTAITLEYIDYRFETDTVISLRGIDILRDPDQLNINLVLNCSVIFNSKGGLEIYGIQEAQIFFFTNLVLLNLGAGPVITKNEDSFTSSYEGTVGLIVYPIRNIALYYDATFGPRDILKTGILYNFR